MGSNDLISELPTVSYPQSFRQLATSGGAALLSVVVLADAVLGNLVVAAYAARRPDPCVSRPYGFCGHSDLWPGGPSQEEAEEFGKVCAIQMLAVVSVLVLFLILRGLVARFHSGGHDAADRFVRNAAAVFGVGASMLAGAFAVLADPRDVDHASPWVVLSTFFLLAVSIGVPGVAAFRAHRRLAARDSLVTQARAEAGDLRLLPLNLERMPARVGSLPIVGRGEGPTHVLVRVRPRAANTAYRLRGASPRAPLPHANCCIK